jgi:hypothetical protein
MDIFEKNITISVTFWIQSIRISLLCYLKYIRNPNSLESNMFRMARKLQQFQLVYKVYNGYKINN